MSDLLIVDDDSDLCELITCYLECIFKNIDVALNVPQAIGRVKLRKYDFIILDLNLVTGSGESVLKYCRRKDSLNLKTPVTVISGEVSFNQDRYDKVNFVSKPFSEKEIKDKIRSFRTSYQEGSAPISGRSDCKKNATHPELLKLLKNN